MCGTQCFRPALLFCLLLTSAVPQSLDEFLGTWAEELPDELLLLQVQHEMIRGEVSDPADVARVQYQRKVETPKLHWSAMSTLLKGRQHLQLLASQAAKRLHATMSGADMAIEAVLCVVALLLWIAMMMICSWLGFGGKRASDPPEEQPKVAAPEHPIDAAAKQVRESAQKALQGKKERKPCC
mmetsp:Transcript_102490/g.182084  ORF Transcript_102490/g.182084 Transcript_102490/m.182084 type:complete len:183 (-) Transcript_102490:80-628(-)